MPTLFKQVRRTLQEYLANPRPLTRLQQWCMQQMMEYHRRYNEAYNSLGLEAQREEDERQERLQDELERQRQRSQPAREAIPSPRENLVPLPPTPISARHLEQPENGSQARIPLRGRVSRIDRSVVRPRRLLLQEVPNHPVSDASEDSATQSDSSESASLVPEPSSEDIHSVTAAGTNTPPTPQNGSPLLEDASSPCPVALSSPITSTGPAPSGSALLRAPRRGTRRFPRPQVPLQPSFDNDDEENSEEAVILTTPSQRHSPVDQKTPGSGTPTTSRKTPGSNRSRGKKRSAKRDSEASQTPKRPRNDPGTPSAAV